MLHCHKKKVSSKPFRLSLHAASTFLLNLKADFHISLHDINTNLYS